jgi:hypothetical protein
LNSKQISSIGRPLDIKYKTNKAIVIITIANFFIGFLFFGLKQLELLNVFFGGIIFGLSFFICWAISREIDPDNPISAFIGLIPLFFLLLFYQNPDLIILFWLLLSLRIINRTTGLPATKLDSIGLLIFGLLLGYYINWIFGFLTGLVLFLDLKLIDGRKFQLFLSSITILFSFILFIFSNRDLELISFGIFESAILLSVSIIFFTFSLAQKKISSIGDQTNEKLELSRIRAAQIFVLIVILILSFFTKNFYNILPLWCSVVGVIINQFLKIITNKNFESVNF